MKFKNKFYAGFNYGAKDCYCVVLRSCGCLLKLELGRHCVNLDSLNSKLSSINSIFSQYNIEQAVGCNFTLDNIDLTYMAQRKYAEKFLASRAAPKVSNHIKYNNDIFPKEIVFERDYYISNLQKMCKNRNDLIFDTYDWFTAFINAFLAFEFDITNSLEYLSFAA